MKFNKILTISLLSVAIAFSAQARPKYYFLSCMLGEQSSDPWVHVKFDRSEVNPSDGSVDGEVSYQHENDFENVPKVTVLSAVAALEIRFGKDTEGNENVSALDASWKIKRSMLTNSLKINISDEVAISGPFVKYYRSQLNLRDLRIDMDSSSKCRLLKSGNPRPGVSGGN